MSRSWHNLRVEHVLRAALHLARTPVLPSLSLVVYIRQPYAINLNRARGVGLGGWGMGHSVSDAKKYIRQGKKFNEVWQRRRLAFAFHMQSSQNKKELEWSVWNSLGQHTQHHKQCQTKAPLWLTVLGPVGTQTKCRLGKGRGIIWVRSGQGGVGRKTEEYTAKNSRLKTYQSLAYELFLSDWVWERHRDEWVRER